MSANNWYAIIGVKGGVSLKDNWCAPYYLGTGDSDFTRQTATGIGYKLDRGDAKLFQRYMHWNFKSGSRLDNLDMSGPLLGVSFHF